MKRRTWLWFIARTSGLLSLRGTALNSYFAQSDNSTEGVLFDG